MPWIMFDEADHHRAAPGFNLEATAGGRVGLGDFQGQANLVIFFGHALDCEGCREALRGFVERRHDYAQHDTQVLVIFPEPLDVLHGDPLLDDIRLPVLSDPGGRIRQKYVAQMDSSLAAPDDDLLFILDQYGAPWAAYIEAELDSPTLHYDTLKWLEFISIQCPE